MNNETKVQSNNIYYAKHTLFHGTPMSCIWFSLFLGEIDGTSCAAVNQPFLGCWKKEKQTSNIKNTTSN